MILLSVSKMLLVKLLLILLSVFSTRTEHPSAPPVVIWGTKLPQLSSVFETMSTEQFISLLRPLRKHHMIIVYFAPSLSTRDLACPGQSECFYNMRQVKPRTYYSQVHRPLRALQMLLHTRERSFLWKDDVKHLPCNTNSIHAYNFTNRNTTDHDSIMGASSWSLTFCPLIQIYTAHHEEAQALKRRRHRLHTLQNRTSLWSSDSVLEYDASSNASEAITLRHDKVLIVLTQIVHAVQNNEDMKTFFKREVLKVAEEDRKLLIKYFKDNNLKNGFELQFNTNKGPLAIYVVHIQGNWGITKMHFDANQPYVLYDMVFFSQNNSICCQSLTGYTTNGSRCTLYRFHMDIIIEKKYSAMDPDYVPKPCWTCETYLTSNITSILFVISILLVMLTVGMSHLLGMGRPTRIPKANEPEIQVKAYSG